MASSLRSRLDELASTFASSVLEVIRAASLDELVGETPSRGARRAAAPAARDTARASAPRRRPGRLPRRSAADVAGIVDRIVALVKRHPGGLRAEQIREELSLEAKELPRPLKDALESGKLGKSGQKRATTYTAREDGGGRRARSRGARSSERQASGSSRRGRRPAKKARAPKVQAERKVEKVEKKEAVAASAPPAT